MTGDPRVPSRLNGSSLENDAFSDKSEREVAEESDSETQDHSRKTNESGSDQSEVPGGPVPRGTTYVEQVQEELWEVRPCPVCDPCHPLPHPHPLKQPWPRLVSPRATLQGPCWAPRNRTQGSWPRTMRAWAGGVGWGPAGSR